MPVCGLVCAGQSDDQITSSVMSHKNRKQQEQDLMTESVLSIREFGVAFGEKIVLSSVSLDVPDRGVIALMGPAGTGKSTLLRTIAGFNDNNPSLRTWGDVDYMGAPLGELGIPPLVSQNARLMLASIFENMVSELPERHTLTIAQQKEVVTRLLELAA